MGIVVIYDGKNYKQKEAIINLLNEYIEDRMGGGEKIVTEEKKNKLLEGLEKVNSIIFLYKLDNNNTEEVYVGMAVCFHFFSTFIVMDSLNIHDFIVSKKYRNMGIGSSLLEYIINWCKDNRFGKITLEVRYDNEIAKYLYQQKGFKECSPPMHFWVKYLI